MPKHSERVMLAKAKAQEEFAAEMQMRADITHMHEIQWLASRNYFETGRAPLINMITEGLNDRPAEDLVVEGPFTVVCFPKKFVIGHDFRYMYSLMVDSSDSWKGEVLSEDSDSVVGAVWAVRYTGEGTILNVYLPFSGRNVVFLTEGGVLNIDTVYLSPEKPNARNVVVSSRMLRNVTEAKSVSDMVDYWLVQYEKKQIKR